MVNIPKFQLKLSKLSNLEECSMWLLSMTNMLSQKRGIKCMTDFKALLQKEKKKNIKYHVNKCYIVNTFRQQYFKYVGLNKKK
jgi:hypothetical protein